MLNARRGGGPRASTVSRRMAAMGMGSATQRPMRARVSAERAKKCIVDSCVWIVRSGWKLLMLVEAE